MSRRLLADPSTYGVRKYDIVKEFVIALVAVTLLSGGLAFVFSSPDEKPITVAEWAKADPNGFTATALLELNGTSGTGGYGPPYNNATEGAKIGPLALQKLGGVTHKIDTAQDFVLKPLAVAQTEENVAAALSKYNSATADQQAAWTTAYSDALGKVSDGDPAKVAAGDYGPVPVILSALLGRAQTGSLDGILLSEHGFYQTDYTLPLLFVADGVANVAGDDGYMAQRAVDQHLGGDQWGMMNETGSFPGQPWLWLYTMWYQVKPFSTSGNADSLVWGLMMVLTLGFVFIPFIPGLRSIPRWIPVYKLVWRDYYRSRR